MSNILYVLYDALGGQWFAVLDHLTGAATVVAISVIIIKNSIAALISLILLFGVISIYLIIIGLTFIGLSYLIVYIGAVSILFLFILMLINIRTSELQSNNSNSIPLALFISLLLNHIFFEVLPYYAAVASQHDVRIIDIIKNFSLEDFASALTFTNIYSYISLEIEVMLATSSHWAKNMIEIHHISAIGDILYTTFNIWLFLAGIILLVAMIGAIIITTKQQDDNRKISSMVERLFYTQ